MLSQFAEVSLKSRVPLPCSIKLGCVILTQRGDFVSSSLWPMSLTGRLLYISSPLSDPSPQFIYAFLLLKIKCSWIK